MSKKEKRYYLLAATGLLLGALLWGIDLGWHLHQWFG